MSNLIEAKIDYNKKWTELTNGKAEQLKCNSLNDALTETYEANMEWFTRLKKAKKREAVLIKETTDKAIEELKPQVEAGTMTQDEMDHEVKRRLRRAADQFKWPLIQVQNLLIVGAPGGGKTSIVKSWCRKNEVGCVLKTGAEIRAGVIGGYPSAGERMRQKPSVAAGKAANDEAVRFLPTEFFDELDDDTYDENILFIDELNRSDTDAEGDILTLVQDHIVPDRGEVDKMGQRLFKRYLFTVAAINPPKSDDTVQEIGQAMKDRFGVYIWNSNKKEYYEFIDEEIDTLIDYDSEYDPDDKDEEIKSKFLVAKDQMLKKIAKAVCNPKNKFQFYDPEYSGSDELYKKDPADMHTINARTLTTALVSCNGTIGLDGMTGKHNYPRGSFLYKFKENCTTNDKKLELMETILKPLAENTALERQLANDPASATIATAYRVWRNNYTQNN